MASVRPWRLYLSDILSRRADGHDDALILADRYRHDEPDLSSHDHDFVEVVVVTEGRGVHESAAGKATIGPADLIVLRPGVWHAYQDGRWLTYLNCCFDPRLLGEDLAWLRRDPRLNHLLWTDPPSHGPRVPLTLRLLPAGLQVCTDRHTELQRALTEGRRRAERVARLAVYLSTVADAIDATSSAALPTTPDVAFHPAVREAVALIRPFAALDGVGAGATGEGRPGPPVAVVPAIRLAAPTRVPDPPADGGGSRIALADRPADCTRRGGGRVGGPELFRPPVPRVVRRRPDHVPNPLRRSPVPRPAQTRRYTELRLTCDDGQCRGRHAGLAGRSASSPRAPASDNRPMDASIYRLRLQDILALCVLGLLFLGILMVQSAAMNVTGEPTWQWTMRGSKHLLFAGLAIIAFFVVGHFDYARLNTFAGRRNPIFWFLAVAALGCLIVLIPGIGLEVNGARRWLPLGITQVQPSELGKWAVVLFLAWWLSQRPVDLDRFWKGFVPTLVPTTVICLLIVIQDFGTAALIGVCTLTMLLAGRVKLWHLAITIPPAMLGAVGFIMSEPYRWRRMTAFLDPWANPKTDGYHMIQSLLSFSSGGVWGKGLGNGVQKLGYLPEDTTDFIFAVVCEELGLFGALLTVALYVGILYVAWQVVRQKRDSFGRMLAFGIGSMIGLQACINIAVATVSVPTKGLALPLVSAGGSGLIIACAALGLLYSIAKHVHTIENWITAPTPPKRHSIPKGSLIAPTPDVSL